MKSLITALLACVVCSAAAKTKAATCPTLPTGSSATFNPDNPAASGYELTFDDEFNGSTLDTTKWSPEWSWGSGLDSSFPKDVAVPGNIVLNNNNTALFKVSLSGSTPTYNSSVATTYEKFSQKYGYFEARIQQPSSAGGIWDGFWLLPSDGAWPPEIDIIEWLGNTTETDWMTLHYVSRGKDLQTQGTDTGLTPGYHVLGVLWTSSSVTWYVDGVVKFRSTTGVPTLSMYMILDSDTGGWNGNAITSKTAFPTTMTVNWVHAWGLPSYGNSAVPPENGFTGGNGTCTPLT